MELDDAEEEVHRLEQEAQRALEENKRYCKDMAAKSKVHAVCLYIVHSLVRACVFFF